MACAPGGKPPEDPLRIDVVSGTLGAGECAGAVAAPESGSTADVCSNGNAINVDKRNSRFSKSLPRPGVRIFLELREKKARACSP